MTDRTAPFVHSSNPWPSCHFVYAIKPLENKPKWYHNIFHIMIVDHNLWQNLDLNMKSITRSFVYLSFVLLQLTTLPWNVNRCLLLLAIYSKTDLRSQKNLTWQIINNKKIGVKKKYYKTTATASVEVLYLSAAEVLSFAVAGGTILYILVMGYMPTYHHYY